MPLVPAICTQCGDAIEVNNEQDAGICPACGVAFITEKVIEHHHNHTTKNYNTTITGGTTIIGDAKSYDDLVSGAETLLGMSEFGKARKNFNEITERYPDRARGWWGLFECDTDGLTTLDRLDGNIQKYYDNAIHVANDEEKARIIPLFEEYKARQDMLGENRKNERQTLEEKRKIIESESAEINRNTNALNTERNRMSQSLNSKPFTQQKWFGFVMFLVWLLVTAAYWASTGWFVAIIIGLVVYGVVVIVCKIIASSVKSSQKRQIEKLDKQIGEFNARNFDAQSKVNKLNAQLENIRHKMY